MLRRLCIAGAILSVPEASASGAGCIGEGRGKRSDNYWYSQGLANLYQQQDEKEKAMKLLEDMSVRFTDKLDPLYALLDIYNRQEQYDKVIATLNRIEEKMGKSEQLSMEKFRIYLQMKDNKNAFHEIESWLRSIRWIPVIRLC